jgi:copper resistance protein B
MKLLKLAALVGLLFPFASIAQAEPLIWGFRATQLEYRALDGEDSFVWDFDALAGSDEMKFVWRSEAELGLTSENFEKLENQIRLQFPISTFFDAAIGAYVDTPDDAPDRYNGVIGVMGLAPQWFEINADLFVSDNPFFRFEAEYTALLTNRLILTPNIEVNLPLRDDAARDRGAGGAVVEIGARLSYDVIDRAFSPYIGVNYEAALGDTKDRIRASGEKTNAFAIVIGARLLF